MRDREIGIYSFERDRLPELFQGVVVPQEFTTLTRLASGQALDRGKLTAVWATDGERNAPLPNLIIGGRETLNDLCAWAKAYMSGLGPVTALIRLVQQDQFRHRFYDHPSDGRPELHELGQQIAIVFAEVAARSGRRESIDSVSLRTCQSTLSFSVFQAKNKGLHIQPGEIADRWASARKLSKRSAQSSTTRSVVNVIESLTYGSLPQIEMPLDSARAAWPSEDLHRNAISRLPKEEIVRLVDKLALELSTSGGRDSRDSQKLASLITQATNGLPNQLALLGDSASQMPEVTLALGVLAGRSPPAEIFSSFQGVGWRLMALLSEPLDPLSRPRCDIALEEAEIYAPIRLDQSTLDPGRTRIEIAWDIYTDVVTERLSERQTSNERERARRKETSDSVAPLIGAVEHRLIDAMEMIRRLREELQLRR